MISRKFSAKKGFTLIELVVVTAIIALITALVLFSNTTFGGQVLLENLAYDMALSIRQAQVYGIAVQRFGTNNFDSGYGVHFETSNNNKYSYITFADACTVNGLYDGPSVGCPNGEVVGSTQIDRGFYVKDLCATLNGTETCGLQQLDILFVRPEPDATISANLQSCPLNLGTCYDSARIQVASPRGDTDSIVVANNGQITVQKP